MIAVNEDAIPHLIVRNVTTRQLLLTGVVGGVTGVVLAATAFNFAFPPEQHTRSYLSDKKKRDADK